MESAFADGQEMVVFVNELALGPDSAAYLADNECERFETYSYEDGDLYHFMDNETYDDIPVNAADVPDNFKFCKENELCKLLSYKGKVFSVEIPNFIELEVTQTEPGVKGNTATNTLKPATVETGAEIRVPLFINEGDHIRIDTRTGEYMERV